MDYDTTEAFDASIRHWQEHSLATKPPSGADVSGSGCALCTLFSGDDCTGCPIRDEEEPEYAGTWEGCDGSPWYTAYTEASIWRCNTVADGERFRMAARSMVYYLEKLRDKSDN